MKSQSGAPRRRWLSQVMTISCRSSGISTSVHPALFMPSTQVKLTTNQHKSTEVTGLTGLWWTSWTNMTCFNFFSVNVTLSRDIQPGNLVFKAIGFDFWKYRNLKTRKPCHIKVSIKGFAISASNLACRLKGLQRVSRDENITKLMRTKTPTAKQASGAEKQWSAASPV